jgi:hypothetical protein
MRRRLYRDCGYSSIHAYAEAVLGFEQAKTDQFIRLAESLDGLPQLRASVETGEMPWTKARKVQVSFALEPEQYTRGQAIVERLRKQGETGTREELLLAAFAALAAAECTRVQ